MSGQGLKGSSVKDVSVPTASLKAVQSKNSSQSKPKVLYFIMWNLNSSIKFRKVLHMSQII